MPLQEWLLVLKVLMSTVHHVHFIGLGIYLFICLSIYLFYLLVDYMLSRIISININRMSRKRNVQFLHVGGKL